MKFQVGDRVYINARNNVYRGTVVEIGADGAIDTIIYVNWDNPGHPFVPYPFSGTRCPHYASALALISPLKQLAECGE